jgi:membrane protein
MEDNAMRLAASLAFYTMLSLAPLLVIAIKIVGAIFGESVAKGQVQNYTREWMGDRAASAVTQMIGPFATPGAGIIATTISAIVLLISASSVFGELQDALNTVWEVKPRPDRRVWNIIKERFFSYVLVLGTCFLLLVSLIVSAALSALTRSFDGDPQSVVWEAINFVLSIVIITLLFALIFKYLPDVKIGWGDVWMGAAATGVLFTVGKLLLGWYLGRASTTSVYGAAGSLVAMLLWVYYSAQILFFGAEITQATAHQTRPRVQPTENAVKVTEEERAQQGMPDKEKVHAAAGVPLPKSDDAAPDRR